MKKVIFISALAIAAAVSCTKSDIVDTKFNEQISFENYIGRDAMTKAAVADKSTLETVGTEIGLYGYYTGAETWAAGATANLWANGILKYGTPEGESANRWFTPEKKYWTNDSDHYSFLAYAPKATDANGIVVGTENDKTQTITYTTAVTGEKLATNVDLLYAQVFDAKKGNGTVNLQFKHALSRVTVKASAESGEFGFDVKNVTLSGTYNTTGTLTLATAAWDVKETDKTEAYYEFCNEPEACTSTEVEGKKVWDVLSTTPIDYSGTVVDAEGKVTTPGDNYLMMIPTNFNGKLTVTYTSIYADKESNEMTKEIPVEINFDMGKAYSLNIVFAPVLDEIKFSVDVTKWDETHEDYNQGLGNPETAGKEGSEWKVPSTDENEEEGGEQA